LPRQASFLLQEQRSPAKLQLGEAGDYRPKEVPVFAEEPGGWYAICLLDAVKSWQQDCAAQLLGKSSLGACRLLKIPFF
jgi:hypothetical protein